VRRRWLLEQFVGFGPLRRVGMAEHLSYRISSCEHGSGHLQNTIFGEQLRKSPLVDPHLGRQGHSARTGTFAQPHTLVMCTRCSPERSIS
jgi:hypothetical protein